jgi:hypothetical protein
LQDCVDAPAASRGFAIGGVSAKKGNRLLRMDKPAVFNALLLLLGGVTFVVIGVVTHGALRTVFLASGFLLLFWLLSLAALAVFYRQAKKTGTDTPP